MSSRDDLQVWASTIDIDPVTSTPQREPILADVWQYGWLRETPVTAQDINQLMYTVTDVVKNDTLSKTANLSDVDDKAAVRANLDLLQKSQNFADVPNKATARTNLDLLQKSQNFADVPDKATARTNLGLDIDTLYNTFFDRMHPVGTVYTVTGVATNPSTLLGRGVWSAIAQGRVLIGVGTGTDVNSVTKTITDGQTSGEYTHTQTVAEMAQHNHTLTTYDDQETGVPGNDIAGTPITGQSGVRSVDNRGSSTPFNVSQPSLGVYYWKRTA